MMRAQIVKELREHARWAGLGAVLLFAAMVTVLLTNRNSGLSVVDEPFTMTSMIAYFNAGLAMGLLVMLGDLRRGHFGFVVHRPLSRGRLFAAKFAAAMLLYAAAGGLALLATAGCAALPRLSHAPFDWPLMTPTLFAWSGGGMWLACGMLIAARRARWFGSRVFPAALPAVATAFCLGWCDEFYSAVLILLSTTVVLFIAGLNYFARLGRYEPQPPAARPVAGVIVFAGAAAVLGLCVGLVSEILRTLNPPPPYRQTERYVLAADGTVYITDSGPNRVRPTRPAADGGHELDDTVPDYGLLTLDRKPVPADEAGRILSAASYGTYSSNMNRLVHPSFLRSYRYLVRIGGSTLERIGEPQPLQWTLVKTRRTIEAYTNDGEYAGCLGPDSTFTPARQPFPSDMDFLLGSTGNAMLIGDGTRAYLVSLGDRQVRPAYTNASGAPLRSLAMIDFRGPERMQTYLSLGDIVPWLQIVGVTGDTLFTHPMADPGRRFEVTLPGGRQPYYQRLALFDNGMAVMVPTDGGYDGGAVVTLRGGQQTTTALPPLEQPVGRPATVAQMLPAAVLPPGYLALYFARAGFGPLMSDPFWPLLLPLGGAAAALVLVLLMARRRGLGSRATVVWAVLAVLGGLHIPLTLLCLREKPTRVPCPACGKRRRVNGDACEHCGAAWPVRERQATDVFEAEGVAA